MNTSTHLVTGEMQRDDGARMLVIESPTNGKQTTLGRQPYTHAVPSESGVTEFLAAGDPGGNE